MSDVFYAGMIPFYLCGYEWFDPFDTMGAVWVQNTELRGFTVSTPTSLPFTISSSHAVVACATTTSPAVGMGTMARTTMTPHSLGQRLDIVVTDFEQLPGNAANFRCEIQAVNMFNPATGGGHYALFRWEGDVQNVRFIAWSWDGSSFGDSPEVDYTLADLTALAGGGTTAILSLDSYNNGRQIVYYNGVVIIDSIDAGGISATPGSYQAITMWWDVQFGSCGDAHSPAIGSADGSEICVAAPEIG